ncbi:hypothetical protein HK405_014962, partial [Cladochytrium tenue]
PSSYTCRSRWRPARRACCRCSPTGCAQTWPATWHRCVSLRPACTACSTPGWSLAPRRPAARSTSPRATPRTRRCRRPGAAQPSSSSPPPLPAATPNRSPWDLPRRAPCSTSCV